MGELEIRSSVDEGGHEPGFLNLTGRDIGRYRIQQRLGRGGVTTVYQAYDTVDGFAVALKVLLHGNDEKLYNRFRHEAQTAARLLHPNIVRTLRVGVTPGADTAYIAMELVEGEDLAAMLAVRRRLSPEDSCRLLEPIARALAYAHRQGVIHRDVKPSNILLRSVGADEPNNIILDALDYPTTPLLSDFGIARALDAPELTNAGRTVGTPAFMAPEQARGQRNIDHRADIYALGAVFYRCITGRQPFTGSTVQILHAHVYESVTISEEIGRQLSQRHIQILQRSLAKDPAARYQNAEEMAQDLGRGIDPARDLLTAREHDDERTQTLELTPTAEQTPPTGPISVLVPSVPAPLALMSSPQAPATSLASPPVVAPPDPHFDQVLDRRLQRLASTLLSLLLTVITLVVIWLFWGNLILGALQRLWQPTALFGPSHLLASTIPAPEAASPIVLTPGLPVEVAVPVTPTIALIRSRQLNRDAASGAAVLMPTAPAPTLLAQHYPKPAVPTVVDAATPSAPTYQPTMTPACAAVIDARLQPFVATLERINLVGFRCATEPAQTQRAEYLRYEQGYMLHLPAWEVVLIGYDQQAEGFAAATMPWEIVDLTLRSQQRQSQLLAPLVAPEDLLFHPKGVFAEAWRRARGATPLGLARTPSALAVEVVLQKFVGGLIVLDHHAVVGDHAPLYVFAAAARVL